MAKDAIETAAGRTQPPNASAPANAPMTGRIALSMRPAPLPCAAHAYYRHPAELLRLRSISIFLALARGCQSELPSASVGTSFGEGPGGPAHQAAVGAGRFRV